MATTSATTYTAKLIDGPLEGKTIATSFLDSGDLQARLEIPVSTAGKRYLYVRASGAEVEYAEGDASSTQPSAVAYRYLETLFD